MLVLTWQHHMERRWRHTCWGGQGICQFCRSIRIHKLAGGRYVWGIVCPGDMMKDIIDAKNFMYAWNFSNACFYGWFWGQMNTNNEILMECEQYIKDFYRNEWEHITKDNLLEIIEALRKEFQNIGNQENFLKLESAIHSLRKHGIVTEMV